MLRANVALLVLFVFTANLQAQTDVAGPWSVSLSVPVGELNLRMFIVQKGTRLSGYLVNETGQFDLEGTVDGNQVKFAWSHPDGGKLLLIAFTGRINRNTISGVAKIGDRGEGALVAERN